jgi:uncharacterized protein (TIGR02145 family)
LFLFWSKEFFGISLNFFFSFRIKEELNGYSQLKVLSGNRNTNGAFNNSGTNTNFWSSSVSGANAWKRNLNSSNSTVNRNPNDQANGFSVRCL